jgi:hypothetical protein
MRILLRTIMLSVLVCYDVAGADPLPPDAERRRLPAGAQARRSGSSIPLEMAKHIQAQLTGAG